MTAPQNVLSAAVSLVESAELPLLAWGEVESVLDFSELDGLLNGLADSEGLDVGELIDEMVWAGLLHEIEEGGGEYRSRAAETVRLLAQLRQLFPAANDPTGAWRRRPRLVRDFRFAARPRRVPVRNLAMEEVLERLRPVAREAHLSAVAELIGTERRLASFQLRSAETILRDMRGTTARGVVVTAGTGGGKTLAFYLPALAFISDLVDDTHWVKSLSVYPRNELLRDQLAAVFAMARRLDGLQSRRGRRRIRLGTLFQETPYKADADSIRKVKWRRRTDGYVCPLLTCPACAERDEHGDLVWLHSDISTGIERLVCLGCEEHVDGDVFPLTRQSMVEQPPDLMFASAEMVHRSTIDLRYGNLVGVHAERGPAFLLLDEVHTYEGVTGAQTALVIRRWKHLVGTPVEVVALSATLPNPTAFVASLAGLPEDRLTHISVREEEIVESGAEYLLALRHDPASGTATLSTTIQTLMCLARCLDPLEGPAPSGGLFGRRVFAFADRLDVANRLYSQFSDAEGRWNNQQPRPGRMSYANLRNPHEPIPPDEQASRRAAGQSWDLPDRLGHDLSAWTAGLHVGRVSSQDPGIDDASSVVVATASLEVGFDDDRVGAVVQHGAPRDMAQFLQRRGRAGRPVAMRPWTTIVLSDYGKDRRSYQAWDGLFDPALPAKTLPIRNRYVLRMHAVHALLDWIAVKLRGTEPVPMLRWDLSEPGQGQWHNLWEKRTEPVKRLLRELIERRDTQAEFLRYVEQALGVSEPEAVALLWHPPRPVLLGAVPTLLRRLETEWRDVSGAGTDRSVPQVPLPDFVSRNLFEALESPDVDVRFPSPFRGDSDDEDTMSFETALREFAPGNSSRRFAYRSQNKTHWVPVQPPAAGQVSTDVDVDASYPETRLVGRIEYRGSSLPVLQPLRVTLEEVPQDLGDRAVARAHWSTSIETRGRGDRIFLGNDAVADLVGSLVFYLHAEGSSADVIRGSTGSRAEQPTQGGERRFDAQFVRGSEPVALGIRHDVDAVGFDVTLPPALPEVVADSPQLARAFRSSWFRHRMTTEPALLAIANKFQLEWVHDAVLASLVGQALDAQVTLEEAHQSMSPDELLTDALDVLFERTAATSVLEGTAVSRLRTGLESLGHDSNFVQALAPVIPTLWEAPTTEGLNWLNDRFRATIAEAVLEAARILCSEHDPDGAVLDLDTTVAGDLPGCWLVERAPGGAGFLESLRAEVASDVRGFVRLIRSSLIPGETERADGDLNRVLVDESSQLLAVRSAVGAYRSAATNAERARQLAALRQALADAGIPPVHTTVAALVSRIARPGSGQATDDAMRSLLRNWAEAESHLGIEIDVRVWTYRGWEGLQRNGVFLPGRTDPTSQLDAVSSLLWPRGWQLRAAGLSSWNPFEEHPPSFPELARAFLDLAEPAIDCTEEGAFQLLTEQLQRRGTARARGGDGNPASLAAFVAQVSCEPIDVGDILAFPRLAEIGASDGGPIAHLELREVL